MQAYKYHVCMYNIYVLLHDKKHFQVLYKKTQ